MGEVLRLEDIEIDLLLTGVARQYGYDFRQYARTSLFRRIRLAMQREGLTTVSALQDRVLHDPNCMARFVDCLSVHVTAMFRDADFFRAFRKTVLPVLRTYPFMRIWVAGCATGEEAYSVAILLFEEGLYDRARVYATDMSASALDRARRGIFPLEAMKVHTANYQRAGGVQDFSSYYVADREHALFRESLRRNIVFSQHNLATDGPFNDFHVILCRNVMIYFNQDLRERVHGLFLASLCKFGFLGIGKKESLRFTQVEACYEELAGQLGLYRRVG